MFVYEILKTKEALQLNKTGNVIATIEVKRKAKKFQLENAVEGIIRANCGNEHISKLDELEYLDTESMNIYFTRLKE